MKILDQCRDACCQSYKTVISNHFIANYVLAYCLSVVFTIHRVLTKYVGSIGMASTSYAATGEMTNLNRVSRLLIGPCSDQFRDLLRFYIPPASFPAFIQRESSKLPHLTKPQQELILPNYGVYSGNYDDMDLSLLYIFLRNVCGIPAHNKGWGETPDPADRSLSANIERIRSARNRCGHAKKGMSKIDFENLWSEIRETVVDLDNFMMNKDKYQKEVDFIRNDTMDPETDKHYNVKLQDQIKEINNLKREYHLACT